MISGEKDFASHGAVLPATLLKAYRVYRSSGNGHPYEGVADYDTIEEVLDHHFHRDAQYHIHVGADLYLTPREFVEWAKSQMPKR